MDQTNFVEHVRRLKRSGQGHISFLLKNVKRERLNIVARLFFHSVGNRVQANFYNL